MNCWLALMGSIIMTVITAHAQVSPDIALPDLDLPLKPILSELQGNTGTVSLKKVEPMLSEIPSKTEERWIKALLPSGREFVVGNIDIPTFLSPKGEYFLLIPTKICPDHEKGDKPTDAVIIGKVNERGVDGVELLIPCKGVLSSFVGRSWRVADIIGTVFGKEGYRFEGLILELKSNH